MNICIAAIHWPVASGRYMRDAFRRLGHDVRTTGSLVGDGTEIWGIRVDERNVWYPDYPVVGDRLALPPDWIPDIVIQMDTHLDHLRAWTDKWCSGVPVVIYSVDNHVRNLNDLGTDFDYYFMAHHDGPRMPVDPDNPKHVWLPCAYDPTVFTPSTIPMRDREWDVAMVGVPYEGRVEAVNALNKAGLKVYAGYGLMPHESAGVYQNARISLCVSAAHDVAQRVFETAAVGCAILSDPCYDMGRLKMQALNATSGFGTPNCMIADDPGGMVAAARWLLDTPPALDLLSEAARKWAYPHTWDARAQTILETVFPKGEIV